MRIAFILCAMTITVGIKSMKGYVCTIEGW